MSNAQDATGQNRYPAMFAGYDDGSRVNDPEERMPRYYGGQNTQKRSDIKTQIKKDARIVGEKVGQAVQGVKKVGEAVGEKVGDAAHQIGSKAKDVGRKIEGKVEQVIDQVRHSRFPWLHAVVAGVVVLVAIKILRTQTAK